MGICLTVVSGKGGTGKSTISSALAISFSKLNKNVLLIDLDEKLGCLDLFFGIDMNIIFDLGDILSGRETDDAVYSIPYYNNIKLIPAPKKEGILNPENFADFIVKQKELFDVVIIDMPAGLDFSLIKALPDDTQHITVCNMDPVSVKDAAVVQAEFSSAKSKPRLIINRFESYLIKNNTYRNIDDIIDSSGLRLLGIVPFSQELSLLPLTHKLKNKASAQKALLRISKRILGENINLPNPKKI